MRKPLRKWNFKKLIAVGMSAVILLQATPMYALADEVSDKDTGIASSPESYEESVQSYTESSFVGESTEALESSSTAETTNAESEPSTAASSENTEETADVTADEVTSETAEETAGASSETQASEDASSEIQNTTEPYTEEEIVLKDYFEEGKIKIYNAEQLKAIGTNVTVKSGDTEESTFGTGEDITADGKAVTYSLDAQYILMNGISLSAPDFWCLPENFTGSFTAKTDKSENPVLYDETTDTIYIYSNYQLMVLASENSEKEPVMTGDTNADTFGMGQFVYADGEENGQNYITYSKTHNYVLSENFTAEMPELKANILLNEANDGRQFAGQVIYHDSEENKDYILIGNEAQLRAIGTDERVYTAVYQAKLKGAKWEVDTDSDGKPIMLYGGDADLTAAQNGKKDYGFQEIEKASGAFTGRCGVNQITGEIDPNMDIEDSGKKYQASENYIIFRDITLTGNWTPLMFSGEMYGRLNMVKGENVTIANVNINQTGKLPIDEYIGIGFFGTISNEVNATETVSKGTAIVSDINISGVNIQSTSTEVKKDFSLIEVLLLPLLNKILTGLQTDPSTFAMGGFAGRIQGDAKVEDCHVLGLETLNSPMAMSGGFVGSVSGTTRYEALTGALGATLDLLSQILNVIPILGLGDLVTILLAGGVLDVGNLVPIGYYSPIVTNCSVSYSETMTSVGNPSKQFNGGFTGRQEGAILKGCSVNTNGSLEVKGDSFVGGFAGAVVNAEIKGLLSSLGVDLANAGVQSVCADCTVTGSDIKVTGSGKYAGGFCGTLNNSYLVDVKVNNLSSVSASSYAGGVTGYSSLGWGLTISDDYGAYDKTLLDRVKELLGTLLTGDNAGDLLSIVGIQPSKIYGASVTGNNLVITASDSYAGGVAGYSDGLTLAKSAPEDVNQLRPFAKNHISYTGQNIQPSVTGLKSVSAGNKYAGGVVGDVRMASAAGILNTTVGLVGYIKFDIQEVNVSGTGTEFTVMAKEYAGGAFGEAIGGTVNNAVLNNVSKVTAENYAGGFVGATGTGSLVNGGGLDLLGLGLVKIDNLLSVADAIETKIESSAVNGNNLTVSATGRGGELITYYAGGFVAYSACASISEGTVTGLKNVSADMTSGVSGGFAGMSTTAGLADVLGENGGGLGSILAIEGLLSAVTYMVPDYNLCSVSFVSNQDENGVIIPQVEADIAGGFAGDFQSGHINDDEELQIPAGYVSVKGIEQVKGGHYAGGFAGKAYAGGLAEGGGLSLLDGLIQTNISNLLSVLNVYMPIIKNAAAESSDKGLKVEADRAYDSYAGGYIGFGSGVQISDSPVSELRHTVVNQPDNLEAKNIPAYYDNSSDYSVIAGKYAGGYAGLLDIGNTANLVDSISVLGILDLGNLLQALDVTASKVNNSTVNGGAGGYSVLASTTNGSAGYAGGYAGGIYGSKVTYSNADNIAYIIGRDSAGGYVGIMEPGDVAKVVEDASVLKGLISTNGGLASVLQSFVPFVENSDALSIPCGSAVRAEKESDGSSACGTAGGFVGHSIGGQIDTCQAIRIRSVFGSEYAGGFTGWAEGANVVDTGSLSLLFGVVKLNNPLQAAQAVYPTEKNTRVSGPMTDMDFNIWDSWAEAVGVSGAYGSYFDEYSQKSEAEREAIYEQRKNDFAYGFNVEAGRDGNISSNRNIGGDAGGYVGRIDGAYIENAVVDSVANVRAYRTAGGFVGNMRAGSVANAGEISLAGINILDNLSIIEAFVPVVKGARVNGFVSGLSVEAYGITETDGSGHITGQTAGRAGGFAGYIVGGQISGIENGEGAVTDKTTVTNLRKVSGTYDVGGFAGSIESGSALDLNADESGLLNKILKYIIDTDTLVSVLNATVSTIKDVEISAWNSWGTTISGYYKDSANNECSSNSTGGFAGSVSGAIIGTEEKDSNGIKHGVRGVTISGLREVYGGEHAGGFVGLADVGSLVNLSKDDTTSILSLIKLGNTSVANMFRTYIYDSHVTGSENYGLTVTAKSSSEYGTMDSKVYTGNAGGFAGSFMNSTVEDSDVSGLRTVSALNSSGGFIGYSGKSGLVDLDQAEIGDDKVPLLNGAVGVLDLFGSTVDSCDVTGVESGFMVSSFGGTEEKAGGFVGFGDLARISNSNVDKLKQVASAEIAGGFAGETSYAYLAKIQVSSVLTKVLVPVLNVILDALRADELVEGNVIKIKIPGLIELDLLYEGDVVYLNLLGLQVSVKIEPNADDESSGLLVVSIGDSTVKVNYHDWKIDGEQPDLEVSLIKANRTKIENSSVTGISYGYDVYAGGSGNDADAASGLEKNKGSSGGFVGYNHEGLLENNDMYFCDVVKGKDGEVGPFTGVTQLDSVYSFNTIAGIEGNDNIYRVYRHASGSYPILKNDSKELQTAYNGDGGYPWNNIYTINHITSVEKFTDFVNAVITDGNEKANADVYISGAKAVLMGNVDTNPDDPSETPLPPDIQDPCEDEFIVLTIHNIWDDWSNYDGIRPGNITIKVIGTVAGRDDLKIEKEIVLGADDAADAENIWSYSSDTLTFKGYELDKETGERLYYTYTVEYETPEGYVSETKVEDYYNFYITHYHRPAPGFLPGTGGTGIVLLNMVGILFLGGFAFMTYSKYGKKRRDLRDRKNKYIYLLKKEK
ncbi:MAG TPA: hypothetical protein IAD22_08135 [Candidatus Limousia pullorum]|uniref:Channel forming colicins domain-containing protein n=1 Tax=Candidatus Limousia pullorum TaxID=2840860 RepID=A0A9D1LZQ6_9FIRM|nr:hypothetical protein [Candidatus Limousia pullorum]